MTQPTPEQNAVAATADKEQQYQALMDSFLNDEKNAAVEKYPELLAAYKVQEHYEIFFLKGARDEVGLVELKKKIGKKIIGELVYGVGSAESTMK
ncbi:hypothetical protein [Porticoccus sp.]